VWNTKASSIERRKDSKSLSKSGSCVDVCDGVEGFVVEEDDTGCEEEAPFEGDSSARR